MQSELNQEDSISAYQQLIDEQKREQAILGRGGVAHTNPQSHYSIAAVGTWLESLLVGFLQAMLVVAVVGGLVYLYLKRWAKRHQYPPVVQSIGEVNKALELSHHSEASSEK